ncbi:unnamed protein product [Mytilus coruscus]|uniref:EGF-like domain-containing protein n=1 Tax=Mytilus coruscus TaxID=42192 RepID=A0A6J7ZV93_MYTCO|nr:unnamed protein product [Mytilus coruscus]
MSSTTDYRTCYNSFCCSGYTGSSCSQAICYGTTSCPNGGTCSSPNACVCAPGFGGSQCSDINECQTGTDNCQQNCINTHGSFICSCESGYSMNSNGATCTDINECLVSNGGCSHICRNSLGSYQCNCRDGFYLASDGKTCVGMLLKKVIMVLKI